MSLSRKHFDGTKDDWRTEPVSFELKEGAKPYHGMSYPVPKASKDTTNRKLNELVEQGVVEFQPRSELLHHHSSYQNWTDLYV